MNVLQTAWPLRAATIFTAGFAIAILWAFLTPIEQLPPNPNIADYIWHIAVFAALIIPLGSTLSRHNTKIALIAFAFATILEFAQPYFGRGFEIHDLISNTIGVGSGWFIARKMSRFFKLP